MLRPGLFVLIVLILGLSAFAAAIGGRWERFSQHWYEPAAPARSGRSEPDEIRRAVYAEGQAWALTDGGLWVIDPVALRASPAGVAAYDICVHDGELTVVTQSASRRGGWAVEKRRAGAWIGVAELEGGGDGLVGLDCGPELSVLTTRRLVTLGRGGATVVELSERVPALPPSVLRSTSDHLLMGVRAGEWDGALLLVDRRTGLVKELAHVGPPQINAITPHYSRPDCSLVSTGSMQGGPGALLEVCGEKVSVTALRREDSFFGMARSGPGVLVTTVGGLYRSRGDGRLSAEAKPSFAQAGPFHVSVGADYVLMRAPADERLHPGGSDAAVIDISSREGGA